MADERHREVVENAIAASLERAMSTAPSAAFLALVRHRMAAERVHASTRRRRWSYVAAACVAAAVAGVASVAVNRAAPAVKAVPAIAADAGLTAPEPMPPARSVPPGPARARRLARSGRRLPEAGEPVGAWQVFVEPGQPEALARLAAAGPGPAPGRVFVFEALDPSGPLPRLRPLDLPRFEMEPLALKAPDWVDLTSEAEGTDDGNEGSDS
jgi:hypothetical protein